jgi:hypothetical protein
MGAWGTLLYDNDTTCDVRDIYTKFLQETQNNEDAYQKTIEELHEYIGDEEEPLFWYALADTQWRFGRLRPEVKNKALEWIDKKGGLEFWMESSNKETNWMKTLQKLKIRLESPIPPEKKIKKPIEFIRNPWNIGDVYVYQFHSEESKKFGLFGKYIALQKIADEKWCDGWILSRVQIYDKVFIELPSLYALEDVRLLPFDKPDLFITGERDVDSFPLCLNAVMVRGKKGDYSEKYFTMIGNKTESAYSPFAKINISTYDWKDMEQGFLCLYYQAWRDFVYEIKSGKSYVYKK